MEVVTKDVTQTSDGDIPNDASSGSTGYADSGDEEPAAVENPYGERTSEGIPSNGGFPPQASHLPPSNY